MKLAEVASSSEFWSPESDSTADPSLSTKCDEEHREEPSKTAEAACNGFQQQPKESSSHNNQEGQERNQESVLGNGNREGEEKCRVYSP